MNGQVQRLREEKLSLGEFGKIDDFWVTTEYLQIKLPLIKARGISSGVCGIGISSGACDEGMYGLLGTELWYQKGYL